MSFMPNYLDGIKNPTRFITFLKSISISFNRDLNLKWSGFYRRPGSTHFLPAASCLAVCRRTLLWLTSRVKALVRVSAETSTFSAMANISVTHWHQHSDRPGSTMWYVYITCDDEWPKDDDVLYRGSSHFRYLTMSRLFFKRLLTDFCVNLWE